jgi:predicted RNase H-like HicB family nuclease
MIAYNGDFHREGDVWVGEVREAPQAHTYGRTLAKAREHLLEALALVLDVDQSSVDIVVNVQLEDGIAHLVEVATAARQRAEESAEESRRATEAAALALVRDAKLSRRDAAAALGLSFQRVDQLVKARSRNVP